MYVPASRLLHVGSSIQIIGALFKGEHGFILHILAAVTVSEMSVNAFVLVNMGK